MRTLSIKTYLAAMSIGITGVIIGIVIFILYPNMTDIKHMTRDIEETYEKFTTLQARALDPKRSLEELANVEKRVNELKGAVAETNKELALIETFEKLAEANHLEQTIKLQGVTGESYRFTLSSKGNFIDHLGFLHALETLPYYAHINKIEWTKERGEQARVTARFDATIYAATQ